FFEIVLVAWERMLLVPFSPKLLIVLGVLQPGIELRKPLSHQLAGRQQGRTNFQHVGIERRLEDELASRLDAFRGEVEKNRLEQYPRDFLVFFAFQKVEAG